MDEKKMLCIFDLIHADGGIDPDRKKPGSKASIFESKRYKTGQFQRESGVAEGCEYSWTFLVSPVCESESFFLYEEKLENQCRASGTLYIRL